MASKTSKIALRVAALVLVLFLLFFSGRPLYWKISATFHDIRRDNQTVTKGFSQIVTDARKTVGWYHDDSGVGATNRKLLRYQVLW